MIRSRTGVRGARVRLASVVVAGTAMATALLAPGLANAAVNNPAPAALVSFTFDDGLASSITQAAPTLQKYGLTGTDYVPTNCIGMTTVPNTCRANTDRPYMSWDQVVQLRDTYGWEIGAHTLDHVCLVSAGGDCQTKKLTAAQLDAQLSDSKSALAAHGIDATAFAPPYGDYDMTAVAQVAKYYTSMRGFAELGNNIWPLGDYLLRNVPVQEVTTPVANLKAQVDAAIASQTWLVFSFHDIVPSPSQNPDDYQYGTAELDQLAAYVKTKVAAGQITNVNVSQGLVNGTPNKMPNPTFNNGLGDGWRTDAPTTITADAANNGSYPDFAKSVKLVSGASTGHLFSPQVAVTPGTNYLYKTYLNVAAIKSGEVAFYVDEYNAAGNWVSGQYRKRENSHWVEKLNFTYMPSSTNVAKASLQVIVAGTGITAYLDNVELLALGAEIPPTPATNLVANGTFDAGISSGWRTDAPAVILADTANNGAPDNPANSVKMQGQTANAHLFSPQVAVTPGNYSISAYLNIKNRTAGEVGWYIDEYDANGNWISGQWKLASTTLGVTNVDLSYSPSTTNVAKASLQVYVTGNSGVLAYLDDVRWWRL
ncbi:polysaccharide deacetylase family protein [Cryobacterium sp. PH29-G1]|uniref:polysaccharide deacetylase family protein n=1 Tax=Cryobacterium sp. PH29-G1 TaxID=3046211 RepID=UPI0024B9EC07|nr:polysaccharide deacetylase family protein [Cryobacterium sp. PH29-G1]MDJ0349420.1 polysaccharide deacetylase family protein [Cryobacterium sp. PH29-G1]